MTQNNQPEIGKSVEVMRLHLAYYYQDQFSPELIQILPLELLKVLYERSNLKAGYFSPVLAEHLIALFGYSVES